MVRGCGLVMQMGRGGRSDIPCLPLEQCMAGDQGKAFWATALASERCAWWCVSPLVGTLKTSLYFNTMFFSLCHKASIVSDSGSNSWSHEIMTTWGSERANFPWICSIRCFKQLRFWGCLLLQLNPTYPDWYINILDLGPIRHKVSRFYKLTIMDFKFIVNPASITYFL